MMTSEQWRAVLATALAFGLASAAPAFAAGWEMRELETPAGEKAVGLAVGAKRQAGVRLVIGCDAATGTQWRGVAVVEEPESKAGLGMRGDVRIRFGETTSRDMWQVRTTPTERRLFEADDATRLARRLLREEGASPAAEVAIEIHGVAGKPVQLTFPLAGLGTKIGTLSEKCGNWDLQAKE